MEEIRRLVEEAGFDQTGSCPASELNMRVEVREMCSSGGCRMYGHNWACPPSCGELEEFRRALEGKTVCYICQTVAELEDEFDIEGMRDAEALQKKRFFKLADKVRAVKPDALLLSAGTCTVCPQCTCPDAPCRFPEKRLSSMEAAGLVVTDVCVSAGIPYNHGKGTISYSSCVVV